MAGGSGGGSVVAALILGAAVVVTGLVVKDGIDGQTAVLAGVQESLVEIEGALTGGALRAGAARPEAPRAPDPTRKVEVPLGDAPVRGPADAEVAIVEYSDFECPFCARVVPTLNQIQETYGDKVKLVYKHLPLRIHPQAQPAAAASEAARLQGKFWEMHDKIFANHRELSDAKYVEWARELGLDVERFERDRKSEAVQARIKKDEEEAARLGVGGTPAFFINGRFLSGAQPFDSFKRMIDEELEGKG